MFFLNSLNSLCGWVQQTTNRLCVVVPSVVGTHMLAAMRILLWLALLTPSHGEHSSSSTLVLTELEECKLDRGRQPSPYGINNRITNVLTHTHDLNVTLKIFVVPPLRVTLEDQTMEHDQILSVHAKVFMKMTYQDPAVPNASYPSLTPPCRELWLPQPRPDVVAHVVGRDAVTNRAATLRVLGDHKTSSLWDEKNVAFPQSGWVFVNFPCALRMSIHVGVHTR